MGSLARKVTRGRKLKKQTPRRSPRGGQTSRPEGFGTPIKAAVAALAMAAFLGGCAHTRAVSPSHCDGWRAIYPTAGDIGVISVPLGQQILGHNEHGAAVCGWVPETTEAE